MPIVTEMDVVANNSIGFSKKDWETAVPLKGIGNVLLQAKKRSFRRPSLKVL